MGYHIFLVGEGNFRTCLRYGLYGGVSSPRPQTNADIIASFEAISPGDYGFFYVAGKGVFGLWRIRGRPFFDEHPVWPDNVYPYRVCMEPIIRGFPNPISLSDVLDLRDQGMIWTFDLGTRSRKNHNPLTEEEGKALIRLLLRNNPVFQQVSPIPEPYPEGSKPLPLNLETDSEGRLKFEGYLNAWFLRRFAQGRLREIVGDYGDFLNYVPTSFNTIMDIFLTHKTSIDSVDILHKFTCMELKAGTANEADLNQIIKYETWLTRKLAHGDSEMVQPILVAFDFHPKVVEYVQKRRLIEAKSVRLIAYRVNPRHDDLILKEVE